jgi:hypothetical protein
MMCSPRDITALYVRQVPLYGWRARPIARPQQSVVCLVDACDQQARQLEATRGDPSEEHHLKNVILSSSQSSRWPGSRAGPSRSRLHRTDAGAAPPVGKTKLKLGSALA